METGLRPAELFLERGSCAVAGRALLAARDIQQGETVITEQILFSGPADTEEDEASGVKWLFNV